ncbi:hypothetical protein GW17_00053869 [Ensete ventricosum]|nr:hypothetical protein GW17_00053869 [Ensete ventricosum]
MQVAALHAVDVGSCPCGRCYYLRATSRGLAASPRTGAAPAGDHSCQRSPLQAAALAARLPLAVAPWAAGPCKGTGRGGRPVQRAWLQLVAPARGLAEIVYPRIPYPDGEDEGGQASSSLAVSIRWVSTAKLLQSDLVTLTQREGGE